MAINKVVYGNDTLIDLTNDTVEPNNLLEGETAHDRSGSPVTGTAKQGHIIQDNNGTDLTQRGTVQFKGVTVTDDATNGKTVIEATKSSVGLGNVPNVTTDNQTPTVTEASARTNIVSGDNLKTIIGKIKKFFTDLKAVAFSGAYSDLSGKPTIPTVYNATLTIQKNGTTVKTFTANASSNVTCNITVPTKLSRTLLTETSGIGSWNVNVDISGYAVLVLELTWYNSPFGNMLWFKNGTEPRVDSFVGDVQYWASGKCTISGNKITKLTTAGDSVVSNTYMSFKVYGLSLS